MTSLLSALGNGVALKAELTSLKKAIGMGDFTDEEFLAGVLFGVLLTYGCFHTRAIENLAGSLAPALIGGAQSLPFT